MIQYRHAELKSKRSVMSVYIYTITYIAIFSTATSKLAHIFSTRNYTIYNMQQLMVSRTNQLCLHVKPLSQIHIKSLSINKLVQSTFSVQFSLEQYNQQQAMADFERGESLLCVSMSCSMQIVMMWICDQYIASQLCYSAVRDVSLFHLNGIHNM